MDAVILLSMLKQVYLARKEDPPEFVQEALNKAVPPLTGLTHFDGSMGNWQGGGGANPETVEQVVEASGVRARPTATGPRLGLSAGFLGPLGACS